MISFFECAVNLGPLLLFANSTPVAWTSFPTFLVTILVTVACKTTLRLGLAKTSFVRYADSDDTLMRFSSMYVTRKLIQTLLGLLFGFDLLICRAISDLFQAKKAPHAHSVYASRSKGCIEIGAVWNSNLHAGFDKVLGAVGNCVKVSYTDRTVLAFKFAVYVGILGVVNEFFEFCEVTICPRYQKKKKAKKKPKRSTHRLKFFHDHALSLAISPH
jgi:hypothetical protein